MSACHQCQNGQFEKAGTLRDLRRAIHYAQSSKPNADSFKAKIPALKEAYQQAKTSLEAHLEVCGEPV